MILPEVFPTYKVVGTCAVIGSSSVILSKEYGKTIDSFDNVFRYNRAPVENYEKYVGTKCTARIVNCNVYVGSPADARFTKEGHPTNFVKKHKEPIIIGNGKTEILWKDRERYTLENTLSFYIKDHASFQKELALPRPATVGLIWIYVLIKNKIVPHVFGFGINENNKATHYWEDRDTTVLCHSYKHERGLLLNWHKNKKIILYT